MAANLVKFMTGTAAQYAAAVKDESTLYFITDERRIYKGTVPYGDGFYTKVNALPASGQINTIYGAADGSVAYWDGTQYQYFVEPFVTEITNANKDGDGIATIDAITDYIDAIQGDIEDRLDIIEGDANTDGSIEHALEEAKDYTDALENGAVADNAAAIQDLEDNKADKGTTLADYGITNAYTITETNTAITTAIANADHLKREIVQALPAVAQADANTIYMILNGTSGDSIYDEWMAINGSWEKIGSSAVDLTGYATEAYVDQAEADAVATAAADATSKANAALQDAQDYADDLMDDEVTRADAAYATAAQGLLAESAVQSVVEGDGNGQIKVDGTNVNVHGLGSAAYTNSNAYDAAGSASTAETNANTYTDQQIAAAALVWQPIASS